ncbi:unnamed protein product [Porites evermanni]|uniref:DOMON domain-containing protein n=1 Tax=Porites evermanni TaxID=104178 RepID=A0ABN8SIW6_9CNID|nr:unnamed protein product [Porites evermanni]
MSVVLLFYRITRDVNPGLANFRNLEEQQFLLGAIGGLSGGTIMIHSDRRASGSRINVVRSEVVSGVTVMPTSSSSTEAPTRQQGSFRFPDNCPDADCDFLVTYQASGANSVVFELRGRGNWVGVGFSEDNQMPDTDILICASDTSLSGHYYATGRSTPARTDPTPLAVEIAEQSFNGGVVSCRITREVNPAGLVNFRNLEEQQFLLGAIGGLSGATIGIHSARRASASKIDVRSGADADENDAIEARVLAHGMLMTMVD